MTDEENYYFDLRGYLVVRGVLTPDQIAAGNNAIDHFEEQISTRSVDEGGLARGSAALSCARGRRELGGMLSAGRHPIVSPSVNCSSTPSSSPDSTKCAAVGFASTTGHTTSAVSGALRG